MESDRGELTFGEVYIITVAMTGHVWNLCWNLRGNHEDDDDETIT